MEQVGYFMFGVGAVVRHADTGKVLILQRRRDASNFNPNEWEVVYGRVGQHEGMLEGLRREIKEETGLTRFTVIRPLRLWRFYRGARNDQNEVFGMTFLIEVEDPQIVLGPEHVAFEWVTDEVTLDRIQVSGIREDLQAVMTRSPLQISDVDAGLWSCTT